MATNVGDGAGTSGTEYTMVNPRGKNGRKGTKVKYLTMTSHGCVKNVENNLKAKKISYKGVSIAKSITA